MSSPVVRLIGYIYGCIGVCSAISFLHPRLRRPESRAVRQAINSWWPPALVGGLAVVLGAPGTVAIFAILSVWTLDEYMRLFPAQDRRRFTSFLAYATVPLHYAALLWGSTALFYGGFLLWTFGFLPLCAAFFCGPAVLVTLVPRLQFGLVLTVLALSHVARLFFFPHPAASMGPEGPAGLAALLLLCIMVSDAGQYVVGKLLGRHRLAPSISPKKTWEGLLGGIAITSMVAAAAAPLVTPLSHIVGGLLGAVLCVGGLLGDLLISSVKRAAGAKDTGAVLPGQGGVLDRCDSLLLVAPLYLYGVALWIS